MNPDAVSAHRRKAALAVLSQFVHANPTANTWSDAARRAALLARKAHGHASPSTDYGPNASGYRGVPAPAGHGGAAPDYGPNASGLKAAGPGGAGHAQLAGAAKSEDHGPNAYLNKSLTHPATAHQAQAYREATQIMGETPHVAIGNRAHPETGAVPPGHLPDSPLNDAVRMTFHRLHDGKGSTPDDVHADTKRLKDWAEKNGHEFETERVGYAGYKAHVTVQRKSFAERTHEAAKAGAHDIDWRPQHSLPEDYYANAADGEGTPFE